MESKKEANVMKNHKNRRQNSSIRLHMCASVAVLSAVLTGCEAINTPSTIPDSTAPERPARALETPQEMSSPLYEVLAMPSGAQPLVVVNTGNPNQKPQVLTVLDPLFAPATTLPAPTLPPQQPGIPPTINLISATPDNSPVKIISQAKPQDRLSITTDKNAGVQVNVLSSSGIGSLVLERVGDAWPSSLDVHLQYADGKPFTRLEGFNPAEVIDDQRRLALKATVNAATGEAHVAIPPFARSKQIVLEWVDAYR